MKNNFSSTSFGRQLMHIGLSYDLGGTYSSKFFNKKLLECLDSLYKLVEFTSISIQCTSSHKEKVMLSRYFMRQTGCFDITPYYEKAEKMESQDITPYHSWEVIDDAKDFHLFQEGEFIPPGLSFHLYPQLYNVKIWEKVTPQTPKFYIYDQDKPQIVSLERKGQDWWFNPKNNQDLNCLPFGIEIWYTYNTIEVDIFINWDVYAIEGTPSNLGLQNEILHLVELGWTFDSTSGLKLPRSKSYMNESKENSPIENIDGFLVPSPLVEMI